MNRVKTVVNDKIVAFEFKANILENNILLELCRELNLTDIYVDIFGIDVSNEDFVQRLTDKNNDIRVLLTEQSSLAIQATVDDIPSIIELLPSPRYFELNIWDKYTEWEQYLKDKSAHSLDLEIANGKESKVYLNYNPLEGNSVELYLDPTYNAEQIQNRLIELIN